MTSGPSDMWGFSNIVGEYYLRVPMLNYRFWSLSALRPPLDGNFHITCKASQELWLQSLQFRVLALQRFSSMDAHGTSCPALHVQHYTYCTFNSLVHPCGSISQHRLATESSKGARRKNNGFASLLQGVSAWGLPGILPTNKQHHL